MKDISRLKSEEFETLLGWLSEDREEAGAEYNKIRAGLLRYFRYKGCSDSHTLADETLNRVAAKIPTLDESKNYKKITVILGFAKNIVFEHLRNRKKENDKLKAHLLENNTFESAEEAENSGKIACMNKCLKEISAQEREIFFEYYGQENQKKSVARRQLAERIGCEMRALQVRVFRLRGILAKCIENCMKKNM